MGKGPDLGGTPCLQEGGGVCAGTPGGSRAVPCPHRGISPSRVDADSLGDCVREVSLVSALTRGARVFLTREEAQHFVKE